jgi:hypothetical protein
LQGGPALPNTLLREAEVAQSLATGDPQLRVDDIHVGGLFGNGVLDLDAGVHLDERVLLADEELDGARVAVADRAGEA